MRIVSLLPSTTEIVCDLGLADELFGVTVECQWPIDVQRGREIVVRTFADPSMTPSQIDEIVRSRVAAGLDLYELDDDALRRCNPDLILSQDLCRVCAVASGDVEAAMDRLACDAQVLQIDPMTLDDVLDSVITIATAAGAATRGQTLVEQLRGRLDAVRTAVDARPMPRVFVLEWVDPPFGAGHWVPDLVRAAGGEPVLAQPGESSRSTTFEAIAAATPDIVIVSPCGFGLSQARAQAESVVESLPRDAQVWAIDADAVMVRPGPRLVDGVEALAAIFHGVTPLDSRVAQRVR